LSGIVVDTSALIAILRNEPDKDHFVDRILTAPGRVMSAVSLQEAGMVQAGRFGDGAALDLLAALVARLGIEVVPHDAALARLAGEAFLRFGKGRHVAGLNFGDCAAYALAASLGLPLLFKGDDFGRTDVMVA